MIEKLIDLLINLWGHATPVVAVKCWMGGAVLRFGKFQRALEPGLHAKWPFAEEVIDVETCVTTLRLPPQTITTKDHVCVVVATIVKYQIKDVEPYVTAIWDQADVLGDITMGEVRAAVNGMAYTDLIDAPPEAVILAAVRKQVNAYGFRVHKVTFTDLGKIHTIRLMSQPLKDLDN